MKTMLISFAVGLAVGIVYGMIRVKSPAPPLVALIGLLGMVWGEQMAVRFLAKPPVSSTVNAPQDSGQSPEIATPASKRFWKFR